VLKRVNKLGLEDYQNHDDIKDIIRCILGLPLLRADNIPTVLQEIFGTIYNDMQIARQLQQLVTYVTLMDRHRERRRFHRLVGHV